MPTNTCSVIQMAQGFSILFAAFNGCTTQISKIYDDLELKNLGQINTFTIYLTFAFANQFAPKMSSWFKHPKFVVIAGGIFYACYYIGGQWTSLCSSSSYGQQDSAVCSKTALYIVNIFFSTLCGLFGAVLIWNGQYAYIVQFSKKKERGKLFGIFWSFFEFSQVMGNGLNCIYYQIKGAVPLYYFTILFVMTMIGVAILSFLPKVKQSENFQLNLEIDGNQVVTDKDSIDVINDELMDISKDETNQNESVMTTLRKMWALQIRPQFLLLTQFMMQNAFLQALGATSQYKVIENTISAEQQKDNMTKVKIGLCFIAYGTSGIIGGHIMAKLLDKYKSKYFVYTFSVAFTCNIAAMIQVYYVPNYGLAYVPACMMGFIEASMNATSSTILSKEYKGKLEAFSQFKFQQSLWTCLPSLMVILISEEIFLYIMVGISAIMTCITFFYKGDSDTYDEVETDSKKQNLLQKQLNLVSNYKF